MCVSQKWVRTPLDIEPTGFIDLKDEKSCYVHNMSLKNPELSYFLSKRDRIAYFLTAITLFFNSKLIMPEKSLNRMFEAIPGYIRP
jgi:hypothetical protein